MAEQKSGGLDQQTLMYILIGVVVVLIAVVGFMIYNNSQSKTGIPAGTSAVQQQGAAQPGAAQPGAAAQQGTAQQGTAQAPAGMGSGSTGGSAAAPVDPKTSTAVTTSPKQWVADYYGAAVKGDWATAYKMLPAANRAQSDEKSFAETQQGYGIKSAKVTAAEEQGNKATVTATLETASFGKFQNTWTFEKVNGTWYVAGKKTAMGGQ